MPQNVIVENPTATGQATAANSISTVLASDQPVIPVYTPATVAAYTATPVIAVNSTSSNIGVGAYTNAAIDVAITAVSGTTPTFQLFVDRLSADGSTWNTIFSTGIFVGVATLPPISLGPGSQVPHVLGKTIRLRYVVGGTSPSFTLSIGIYGR
jgi:3D (Asp-Asp-Asp) domain-containing protein